jgi:GxxExxY protein
LTDHGVSSRDAETYAIIGAAMEVYGQPGHGFLEAVYQDALAAELEQRGIAFERELEILIVYKGARLPSSYRADFVCGGPIIVELKALGGLTGVEESQVINYLKTTGIKRGLLLNFGARSLQYKRLAL